MCRTRLESLSKTLKRVKADSAKEVELLEQGTYMFNVVHMHVHVELNLFSVQHTITHSQRLWKLSSKRYYYMYRKLIPVQEMYCYQL